MPIPWPDNYAMKLNRDACDCEDYYDLPGQTVRGRVMWITEKQNNTATPRCNPVIRRVTAKRPIPQCLDCGQILNPPLSEG